MSTRYEDMIVWGLIYLVFCICLIKLYEKLYMSEGSSVKVCIGRKTLFHIYFADIFMILFLVLIIGFRCNCGSDYYNYYQRYEVITDWYSSFFEVLTSRFQSGFDTLCYIVKSVIGTEFAIFPVTAILMYIPMMSLIRKYSVNPVVSFAAWVLLGFLSMTTNILKQSFAMILILYAYENIEKKKYVKAIILCILSCVFHMSAGYVCVIMFVAKIFRPTRKFFVYMSLFSVGVMIFLKPIFSVVTKFLPAQYRIYANAFLEGNVNELKLQIGGVVVVVFYVVLIWCFTEKKFFEAIKNTYYERMLTVCILCMPWLFLAMRYYILNRVAYEGLIFSVFLIPMYLKNEKRGVRNFIIAAMIIFSVLTSVLCAENNYYSYSTIFNDTPASVSEFVRRGGVQK